MPVKRSHTGPTHGFSCSHYEPAPGGRRCRSYIDGGTCGRIDGEGDRHGEGNQCMEWLRVNEGTTAHTSSNPAHVDPVPRDLFGSPIQPPPPRPARRSRPAPLPTPSPVPKPLTASREPSVVRNTTSDEISSFKALGVEVCLRSDAIDELWIVPNYTGKDRTELSVEHSATLTTICAAFPGARVVALNKEQAR